jgi:hypothetical protein
MGIDSEFEAGARVLAEDELPMIATLKLCYKAGRGAEALENVR